MEVDATIDAVRKAILSRLGQRNLKVTDVAADLNWSRAHLQRQLAKANTSFKIELQGVRVEHALARLLKGRDVALVASQVGLSPDYLTKLIRPRVGLLPRELKAAGTDREMLVLLDAQTPPRAGTQLYRSRRYRRERHCRRLARTLVRARQPGPLDAWIEETRRLMEAPDHRRSPHREQVREARERERERDRQIVRAEELRRQQWYEERRTEDDEWYGRWTLRHFEDYEANERDQVAS